MFMGEVSDISYEAVLPVEMKGVGKIALNRDYLLPPASIFSEMELQVTHLSAPVKIIGDLQGVLVVIMPIHVQWGDEPKEELKTSLVQC